jgi:predicted signal transduction protein with EAL and GGDEF domain
MRLARRVCTALGESYHVNGHELTISASIGIALGPVDGEPSDALLKNADLALYRAKEDGRNTFRFFEPAMDAALQKRRRLEADLRAALRKNQLYLDYQPQFDLETGRLTGYEALVRWWHPTEGEMRPPPSFRSPRRPASSCRSANGSCERRVAMRPPGLSIPTSR